MGKDNRPSNKLWGRSERRSTSKSSRNRDGVAGHFVDSSSRGGRVQNTSGGWTTRDSRSPRFQTSRTRLPKRSDISPAEIWDMQLEADVAAGRLDDLAEEALRSFHNGETTEL